MKPFVKILYRVAIVTLVVYWVGLFVATHVPGEVVDHVHTNDTLLHTVAYLGLTCLLTFVVLGRCIRPWYVYATLFLIVAVYGAIDEMTQTLSPGRQADLGDWFCDLAGAALGLAGYYGLQRLATQLSPVT